MAAKCRRGCVGLGSLGGCWDGSGVCWLFGDRFGRKRAVEPSFRLRHAMAFGIESKVLLVHLDQPATYGKAGHVRVIPQVELLKDPAPIGLDRA